ncbi:unnamed protein product [Amoebophrya sp. A25]|nr:unnamed protein product [Amoebophrya sp. A25]|eukprot:GSA25T00022292001.1
MVLPANEAVKPYVRYLPRDPHEARERIKRLLNCEHLVEGNAFRGFQPSTSFTPGVNDEESTPGKRFYNTEFWLIQEDFVKQHLKGAEVTLKELSGSASLNGKKGVLTGEYKMPVGHPGRAKDRYAVRMTDDKSMKLIAGANLSFANTKIADKFAASKLLKQNARASAFLTALNSIPLPSELGGSVSSAAAFSGGAVTNYIHVGDHSELAVRARGDVYMLRVGPCEEEQQHQHSSTSTSSSECPCPKYESASSSRYPLHTTHVLHTHLGGCGILFPQVDEPLVGRKKQLLPFDRRLYDKICGIFNIIPLTKRVAMGMVMKNDEEGQELVANTMRPIIHGRGEGGNTNSASSSRSAGQRERQGQREPTPTVSEAEMSKLSKDVREWGINPPEEEPSTLVGQRVHLVDYEADPHLNGHGGTVVKVLDYGHSQSRSCSPGPDKLMSPTLLTLPSASVASDDGKRNMKFLVEMNHIKETVTVSGMNLVFEDPKRKDAERTSNTSNSKI